MPFTFTDTEEKGQLPQLVITAPFDLKQKQDAIKQCAAKFRLSVIISSPLHSISFQYVQDLVQLCQVESISIDFSEDGYAPETRPRLCLNQSGLVAAQVLADPKLYEDRVIEEFTFRQVDFSNDLDAFIQFSALRKNSSLKSLKFEHCNITIEQVKDLFTSFTDLSSSSLHKEMTISIYATERWISEEALTKLLAEYETIPFKFSFNDKTLKEATVPVQKNSCCCIIC